MLTKILTMYIPRQLQKKKLQELSDLTAAAFGCPPTVLAGTTLAARLEQYAVFTAEQAEKALEDIAELEEIRGRLFDNAYIFGRHLRKILLVRTWTDAMVALTVAYRLIGIDFSYDGHASFSVRQCFFSQYYSPQVCQLISALDEGMVAGISGGKLRFTQRMTQGCPACAGSLEGGKSR